MIIGILTRAVDSKEETRGATVKEYVDLWKISRVSDNYTGNSTTQSQKDLLDDLENQKLLINDERNKLETGETITIGSKQISLGTNELFDLDKLKITLKTKNFLALTDSEYNISLSSDEKLIFIDVLSNEDVIYKYNDNYYKLTLNEIDEEHILIDEVSNLSLVDKILILGELIDHDDNSAIYKYNHKLYTIGSNHNDGFEIISEQDLIYTLNATDGCFFRLQSNGLYGGTMTHDILSEYNPKIKIEGVNQEIDLTPYIIESSDDVQVKIISLYASNGLAGYSGKTAIVSLVINGKEITWSGTITGSCCFDPGSQVLMADGTTKAIEDVNIGDMVMSLNEDTGEYMAQKVKNCITKHNSDDLVYVNLSNGTRIGMRAYHPLLTTNGWKSLRPNLAETTIEAGEVVGLLEVGDTLVGYSENVTVVSIEQRPEIENYDTYNLSIEGYHNYIVNGVVVHNPAGPSC